MAGSEERLAELLRERVSAAGPVSFGEVARGARRRSALRWSSAAAVATAAVLVAVVALAGLPGGTRSSGRGPVAERPGPSPVDLAGAVPWTDAPMQRYQPPPAQPPAPRRTDARPCTAEDVEASFGQGDGAGGHLLYQVLLRNVGDSTCVLKGFPQVVATEPGLPAADATCSTSCASTIPPTGTSGWSAARATSRPRTTPP